MTTKNLNSVPEEQVGIAEDAKQIATAESAVEAVANTETDDEVVGETEAVSFAEEDAALAAEAPEFKLENDEMAEESAEVDERIAKSLEEVSQMTKGELVEYFAGLLENKPVQSLRYDVEAVKVAFYKKHRADVDELRKKYVEEGGVAEEFEAPADSDEIRLKEYFGIYRTRREEYMNDLEKSKEENLKIKLQIIEELKALVEAGETVGQTFQTFRQLQQRWKETGIVPQANVKEIWETYNLHVENFYNVVKINKELRDLDLQRNLEAKVALCEAAESLAGEESIVAAFRKLQDLHDQWREIGPVVAEQKEAIWERFKEASSRINRQHQEHFEAIKEEQKKNLALKTELCEKAEGLATEMLTTRKEWNKASDKLIEIQKVWKTIGFAPKKDNTKIYERFRRACDRFFELKRAFYEGIKSEMEHNLQLKIEICEAAEAIQDSEQWKKTSEELIALQKRWKEIGSVSRRHSDAVWKRFRAACDHFFARKSEHFASVDAEHSDNLARKIALVEEIEAYDITGGNIENIKEFQRRWSEIGFVPIKEKEALQKRYRAAIDKLFAVLRSGDRERGVQKYRNKLNEMKGNGGKLRNERDRLYNKVKQLETDIATLENNIGFFARSKGAEALIRDVEHKIERAKQEMAETIEKINLIDSQQE
ncbi:MAG: DUF349 domain-containing protein [Tidjanibacter sp.]|nr:DUF349 domain-containing protein [Tidjanibacter sp.]